MKKDKWIWMPHPAHFICAKDCRFHLATYVGGYIVSTVGELWFERGSREIHASIYDKEWFAANQHLLGDMFDAAYFKRFGYEELHIGGWTYETMVFPAKRNKKEKGEMCCPWRAVTSDSKAEDVYKSSDDAYRGHMGMCNRFSKSTPTPKK